MPRQQQSFRRQSPHLAWFAALTLPALWCAAPPAMAALGDTAASVSGDSARLRASLRVVGGASYSVHELTTVEGTAIREFVTPAGSVFAVAWRGPFKPDLRLLLGAYFDLYVSAPRSAGSTRTQLAIDQPALAVRAGGHMRAFAGVAWVPALVPAGVSPGELQ
ncbi:MAG TPA: DUF2844 domain-containing protein [Steroidobacteraceae bacterium]|nr:DUF2844 domain-containing protein [Steroidobacteraceae bacterium]